MQALLLSILVTGMQTQTPSVRVVVDPRIKQEITSICEVPKRNWLAVACANAYQVRLFDSSGNLLSTLELPQGYVGAPIGSPDARGKEGSEENDRKSRFRATVVRHQISKVAVTQDGKFLAVSGERALGIFDLDLRQRSRVTGSILPILPNPQLRGSCRQLTFSDATNSLLYLSTGDIIPTDKGLARIIRYDILKDIQSRYAHFEDSVPRQDPKHDVRRYEDLGIVQKTRAVLIPQGASGVVIADLTQRVGAVVKASLLPLTGVSSAESFDRIATSSNGSTFALWREQNGSGPANSRPQIRFFKLREDGSAAELQSTLNVEEFKRSNGTSITVSGLTVEFEASGKWALLRTKTHLSLLDLSASEIKAVPGPLQETSEASFGISLDAEAPVVWTSSKRVVNRFRYRVSKGKRIWAQLGEIRSPSVSLSDGLLVGDTSPEIWACNEEAPVALPLSGRTSPAIRQVEPKRAAHTYAYEISPDKRFQAFLMTLGGRAQSLLIDRTGKEKPWPLASKGQSFGHVAFGPDSKSGYVWSSPLRTLRSISKTESSWALGDPRFAEADEDIVDCVPLSGNDLHVASYNETQGKLKVRTVLSGSLRQMEIGISDLCSRNKDDEEIATRAGTIRAAFDPSGQYLAVFLHRLSPKQGVDEVDFSVWPVESTAKLEHGPRIPLLKPGSLFEAPRAIRWITHLGRPLLATGYDSGLVEIRDLDLSGNERQDHVLRLWAFEGAVVSLRTEQVPGHDLLYGASEDGTIRIWSLPKLEACWPQVLKAETEYERYQKERAVLQKKRANGEQIDPSVMIQPWESFLPTAEAVAPDLTVYLRSDFTAPAMPPPTVLEDPAFAGPESNRIGKGKWIAVDRSGHFDGAEGFSSEGLHYVANDETAIEPRLAAQMYYEPGLLSTFWKGGGEFLAKGTLNDLLSGTPPRIEMTDTEVVVHAGAGGHPTYLAVNGVARLRIPAEEAKSETGFRIKLSDPAIQNAITSRTQATLASTWIGLLDPQALGQPNVVSAKTLHPNGTIQESAKLQIEKDAATVTPRTAALLVGCSPDKMTSLPAVAKDLKAMNDLLQASHADRTISLGSQVLGKRSLVTKKEILDSIETLAGLNLGPDDTLFLYFSGHGAFRDGRYVYFCDGDAGSDELTSSDLSKALQAFGRKAATGQVPLDASGMPRLLIIFDTCYSSTFNFNEITRLFGADPIQQTAAGIMASRNAALENDEKLGHGVLTFSILDRILRAGRHKEEDFYPVSFNFGDSDEREEFIHRIREISGSLLASSEDRSESDLARGDFDPANMDGAQNASIQWPRTNYEIQLGTLSKSDVLRFVDSIPATAIRGLTFAGDFEDPDWGEQVRDEVERTLKTWQFKTRPPFYQASGAKYPGLHIEAIATKDATGKVMVQVTLRSLLLGQKSIKFPKRAIPMDTDARKMADEIVKATRELLSLPPASNS